MHKKIILLAVLVFLWSNSAEARKHVVIDLSTQTATAYDNDIPQFSGRVSTGKPGRRTPHGTFYILEKQRYHKSSSWPKPNGGAVMNYMQRLTNSGIAMHLGYVPNYPASHGCIRLENGFAQRMFRWTHRGLKVRIVGTPPARVYRKQKVKKRYTQKKKYKQKAHRSRQKPLDVLTIPSDGNGYVSANRKVVYSSIYAQPKTSSSYRKPSTLDMISQSPKKIDVVKKAQEAKWKKKRKKKLIILDPLKAMQG